MPTLTKRTCRICKKSKMPSDFHLNGYRRKDGTSRIRNDCKKCSTNVHQKYFAKKKKEINEKRRSSYREDRSKAIDFNLKRYYGIDLEYYNKLFSEQKGRCKLCFLHQSEFSRRFDVDHNHKTGKIRGLLCIRCNRGIGLLKDNIKILQRAIEYLKQG